MFYCTACTVCYNCRSGSCELRGRLLVIQRALDVLHRLFAKETVPLSRTATSPTVHSTG